MLLGCLQMPLDRLLPPLLLPLIRGGVGSSRLRRHRRRRGAIHCHGLGRALLRGAAALRRRRAHLGACCLLAQGRRGSACREEAGWVQVQAAADLRIVLLQRLHRRGMRLARRIKQASDGPGSCRRRRRCCCAAASRLRGGVPQRWQQDLLCQQLQQAGQLAHGADVLRGAVLRRQRQQSVCLLLLRLLLLLLRLLLLLLLGLLLLLLVAAAAGAAPVLRRHVQQHGVQAG